MPPGPPPDEPKNIKDMTDTERVKFNTRLVNSCFDDIELFVNKLYKVADAMKQHKKSSAVSSSKSDRKTLNHKDGKSRNNSGLQGMIQLRATPPKQEEFIQIFKKIKFSLNVMADLEGKVLNPTPSEMFRHLQNPFIFMVQTTGGTSLASSIKNPLLKRTALDMIYRVTESNTMASIISTSHWIELGENWNKPYEEYFMKDQRESDSYCPIFSSGWSPINQLRKDFDSPGLGATLATSREKALDPTTPRKAVVMQAWLSNMPREISVNFGDQLDVLDGSSDWWKCRNHLGVVGYVPHTVLEYLDDLESRSRSGTLKNRSASISSNNKNSKNSQMQSSTSKSEGPKTFEFALRQFKNGNLDIDPDDRVGIIEKISNKEWFVEDSYQQKGLCPSNIFEPPEPPPKIPDAGKGVPVPPPMPPKDSTPTPSLKSSSAQSGASKQILPPTPKIDNEIPKHPPPVNASLKLLDQLVALKDFKNNEINIIKGSTINIYSMDGNWWKCSGSRLGIGFAPKSLFAVKNKPNVPKKSETTKKTSSDAVSLTSVKTDFQNDIINKNFKLKKVEKTDDSQFSDQPPLKPKPVEKFLAEPQTNEEEEKGDQTIRNTVNMRRRASRNQTPNIATVSQVQRPEMTDLINSISSRIESNNKSKFNIKGNRKSMIEGQGLMITSKSSKNEVRAWLEAICGWGLKSIFTVKIFQSHFFQ